MKKLFKLITWPLVLIFLHQNIGWTVPSPQLSTISYQLSTIFIPEQYGRVEKTNRQTGKRANGQTVVLIKDAHCNYEAQTNIAKILDILIRDYKIELVGEEGASGYINPSIVLESNPSEEDRKDVSDKFLKNGLLVASEALSINKGREPGFTIWGIEDLRLYLEDYKAFRDTFGTNFTGKHFIELLSKTIEQLKRRIYPEELQGFDRIVKGYESNEIPLSRFIKVLYYNHGIPSDYKNLKLILKSIRLEEEIDFNNVERERANLIKGLEKSLPSEDLQELIKQSLLYKLGKIPVVEYYKYLEPLATSCKPQAKNLIQYIKLVKLQEKLDETILFKELEILLENIYIRLCTDKTSLNLHQLDKDIGILNKIFNLEATRENLAYYKENQIRFKPENLLQFIKIQAPLNNINLLPELNDPTFIEDVNNAITPAEEFYRLAVERDTALVENLLGVMQRNKKDKAALVCGGFHAEGIKKILEDKGISILTVTPSITKLQEDSNEIYLRRMMDERVDPERMLSELGMETLRPPIATGPEGIRLGLPQPLIDALRGRGLEVGKGLKPEEFLRILPLLQKLYRQNDTLRSFIEQAVEEYNAKLPEKERIVLGKSTVDTILEQVSDEKFYITELDEFRGRIDPKQLWDRLRSIITNLETTKRNWYWNHLTLEAKIEVTRRLIRLIDVCEELNREHLNLQEGSSIICFGSMLWGEGGRASDIDIFVAHRGETIKTKDQILIEKLKTIREAESKGWKRFPEKDREANIMYRDTEEIRKAGQTLWKNRGRFMFYGSGIALWGSDFEIFDEPINLFIANTESLVKEIEIHLKDLSKPGDKVHANRKILRRFVESCIIFSEIYNRLKKTYADDELIEFSSLLQTVQKVINAYNEGINDTLENMFHRIGTILGERDISLDKTNITMWQKAYNITKEMVPIASKFTLVEQAKAPAEPPAHITYMGVPEDSPHYSAEKIDVEKIITDLEGKTVSIPFERKTVNVDKQLLERLEVTDMEFLSMLIVALIEAEKYPGADKSRLRDNTTIALLDKSSHLAENHVGDGFIGINAYMLELYQKLKERFGKAAANNFIQFLLEHELVHELTNKGEEIESDLMKRDAERFVSLFGENTDAILDLLYTTGEFIEWVKFYSYKDTATKSFGALNRTKYEEDLVQALESGETMVQVAHLKIQDFKGEFNTRGEDWSIGHVLGDVALEIIGFALQRFIDIELEKYGAKATVYNQGPGFYIIFQNITNPSIVKGILEKLVKKDSEFKKAVIEGIKWELKNILPPDVYRMVSYVLNTLTTDNLNIYGGISELQRAGPKELEGANAIADRLDIQAIEIAKYAQLTINRDMTQRYIEILARATSILEEGKIEEDGPKIDEDFTELLEIARDIPESNIEQFDTTKRERVKVSKAYVLNREYTSFHIPMEESYKPEEAFEELFREYAEALEKGDFENIRRIQKVIARKTVSYKDTQIYYGNQRFKDTIEYIIRNRPKVSLRLTFRIGGDEYGKLVWDAESKVLRILRFDGNNIGATTFQWGREIGDKVIDEQLRIIQETEDVGDIPEGMLKFFDNMGGRALPISKKLYNQLKNRLSPDCFEIRDGQYFLIKIPDVTVAYRGKTFTSRPMVSIGEVVVDTKLIPEDKLDREYSTIQGRADNAANRAKDKLKHHQSRHNGQIDTSLAYETAPAFTSEHIQSFREYIPPRANSEIAEFIIKSSEIRIVASEIAKIIDEMEEKEIEEAILSGLERRERINIMELLNLAKLKGLNPEQVFGLAVKIGEPLDKLLGKEAREKGDEVLEAILIKIVGKIPEGITAREQFIDTLKQTLKNLGISAEEIDSELELIEMGLHIIAFDSLLDITEIDASYFDFITQLAQMSGVSRDTVVKAFTEEYFDKQIELLVKDLNPETRAKITKGIILEELRLSDDAEKLLFRKMSSDRYKRIQEIARGNKAYFEGAKKINLPGSELLKAVNRLKLYEALRDRTNVDLDLEGVNDSFNNLDFPNGTVRREPVRYLSALQAVEGDLGKVFEPFLGAFQKEQPVFLSIPAGQFITEFLINESGGLEILHNPGLHAFINRMKQTRISFKLELRAKDENEKRLLDKVLEANPEFKDYLVTRLETDDLLSLRDSISSSYNIPRQNIVIITGKDFKPNDAITSAIRDNQLKIFGNTSESAFHAVLLFGVFFALTEKVVEDGRISSTVIEALRTLGVDENEINRISKGGLFFTVKLIRIKETLQEFRNRKLFIEVAA